MKIMKSIKLIDTILHFVMWLLGKKEQDKEPLKPLETNKES